MTDSIQTDSVFGSGHSDLSAVLSEFLTEVDPKLLDEGWGFEVAKGTHYGQTDQSMVNHVRNGVFALARLNEIVPAFGAYQLDDSELRQAIALFVIHDLHKYRDEETTAKTEYDIDSAEVAGLVETVGVNEFAPSLRVEDFHACTVDHENSWKSNPEQSTRTYDRLRPFVRLADAFASCETPESAASERNERALDEAYPGVDLDLRYHVLDDVKGIFTNLLNGIAARELNDRAGYELLLIYQDGCVYVTDQEPPQPSIDEDMLDALYTRLTEEIGESHPAYDDRQRLAQNLGVRSQGFYAINDQDFFYAGAPNILLAVTVKATQDADPDSDPTDSMRETMELLNERLSIDIDSTTRVAPGYARLVYTVKRAFVDPLVDEGVLDDDALTATCRLFGVDHEVTSGLRALRDDDEVSLTAGGKWDYGYAIGQHIAEMIQREGWSPAAEHLAEFLLESLENRAPDWRETVMAEHAGEFEMELTAYIADVLTIDGHVAESPKRTDLLTDPFDEHHATRRGKTCTFCNRGTTSGRKGDMKAPKSLTTFQAGYSNRIPANAGKPEELLACIPCQVEFSLRETGSTRREAGRLFIHLVPDYFYTPTMWSLYDGEIFTRFTGEAMTRVGRLASAVFDATADGNPDEALGASFADILSEAAWHEEGGRSMLEQLGQEFDSESQFGTRTLSFYKPQDNETEFQFFGVFLGLSIAAAMGMRVYISQSPMPDLRGRDFREMARLDAGFTRVADFYGQEIPLSVLRERLGAAAALVQLGYELAMDDARFPKYLRVTRNKPLPGSHLLKKAARDTDDGSAPSYLLEEADFLDRHASQQSRTTTSRHSTTTE
ncbi:type I-D CRISPR-associated protein Cas10d/Csc3 [Haloarcula sp. S1CR25-12]|uniref:Type I-D CRISPR-associated protein Cas10d/Csc3 n=1 Tax=Haloarcula saliterrae TaxID=2950534 RepID=A0ABU2FE92_9EURY|nr:type I-D CRISPR-associated protein Cas10d/Csc3 [Haloarcula sp. S1CR25-12]MDS0260542.1 type I-D CRISPR-associated protein Cas10d/Csc3 [Haloarcula sp. S1CR25-12]